jgi:predicted lipase
MPVNNIIQVFDEKQVRTAWHANQEKWYFSIIDVIAALTGTDRPRKYWNDLKTKLLKEGSELSDKIGQLKMPSSDGKTYKNDVADTEQLFRLIQSIRKDAILARNFTAWNGR